MTKDTGTMPTAEAPATTMPSNPFGDVWDTLGPIFLWVGIALVVGTYIYAAVLLVIASQDKSGGNAQRMRGVALAVSMGGGLAIVIGLIVNASTVGHVIVAAVNGIPDPIWPYITGAAIALVIVNIVLRTRRSQKHP